MDQKDLSDRTDQHLEQYIPLIGEHLDGWKDVTSEKDAVIFKLSGLSNITCMVKAKSKDVKPRHVIFRVFENALLENDLESAIVQCLSDQNIGTLVYYQNEKYRIEESFDARPITIFEMRNPVFLNTIIAKTFQINYNKALKEKIIELRGKGAKTQIEILRDKWIPKLREKWQRIYDLLTVEEHKESMDKLKAEWMREDINEYIDALSYGFYDDRDNLVVTHNDIQECNVLSMRENATQLALIDYEYTTLGNREFDLANTFCELGTDNAYPYYPYIAIYPENLLTEDEYHTYSKNYLTMWYNNYNQSDNTLEEYLEKELPIFLENLYCSMILDGIFWGVWAILMLDEAKANDRIFNFAFVSERIALTTVLLDFPFIREAVENKLAKCKESKQA